MLNTNYPYFDDNELTQSLSELNCSSIDNLAQMLISNKVPLSQTTLFNQFTFPAFRKIELLHADCDHLIYRIVLFNEQVFTGLAKQSNDLFNHNSIIFLSI